MEVGRIITFIFLISNFTLFSQVMEVSVTGFSSSLKFSNELYDVKSQYGFEAGISKVILRGDGNFTTLIGVSYSFDTNSLLTKGA